MTIGEGGSGGRVRERHWSLGNRLSSSEIQDKGMSRKTSVGVKPRRRRSGSAGVEHIRTSGHSIHGGIPCEGAGAEFLVWMEATIKRRMVKMGNRNQRLSTISGGWDGGRKKEIDVQYLEEPEVICEGKLRESAPRKAREPAAIREMCALCKSLMLVEEQSEAMEVQVWGLVDKWAQRWWRFKQGPEERTCRKYPEGYITHGEWGCVHSIQNTSRPRYQQSNRSGATASSPAQKEAADEIGGASLGTSGRANPDTGAVQAKGKSRSGCPGIDGNATRRQQQQDDGKSSQLPETECLWRSSSDRDSSGDARADTSKEALRKSRTMISIIVQLRRRAKAVMKADVCCQVELYVTVGLCRSVGAVTVGVEWRQVGDER
ncbi:hypothetical protein C8F04DRAFT_1238416 [Mycena alexandri]|uniref:Uncharacterized protein n=1 Tax=Mycena alexandri TaxID=1745969 RepID=A0AAD6WXA8_9AGAR|nr:hypothetical protein C8F04DRAFT_1238416 [Mycena alexandri]